MKITIMTALTVATLAFAPMAQAQEGNGDPFPLRTPGFTSYVAPRVLADGSTVMQFSQVPVQTADALPFDGAGAPAPYAAVQERARLLASRR